MPTYSRPVPMRIQARPGSRAEADYYLKSGLPSGWVVPAAIAEGIEPSPLDDLIYHGGKLVPQMEFQNVYLGGPARWRDSDIEAIDRAILLAMRAPRLNNVIAQYFPGAKLSCDARESFIWDHSLPSRVDEPAVQATLIQLFDEAAIAKTGLDSCLFNLMLPPGAELRLDSSSSLRGLGGYHGSVHFLRGGRRRTLYYSANAFSQFLPNGRENGIVAFDRPWKNVVATLYHEINEFRTDADVNDAIALNDDSFLGWTSRRGSEIGDQPIFVADDLRQVFKQVRGNAGGPRLPIQLMYSNAVHGAEGPLPAPHAASVLAAKARRQ